MGLTLLVIITIIILLLYVIFLFLSTYIASNMPYLKIDWNDREKAKEIFKKEVLLFSQKYYGVFGQTSPSYLIPLVDEFVKKLNDVDCIFVFENILFFESEKDKSNFLALLSNPSIKKYKYSGKKMYPHFRICDDKYAYVEYKHNVNQIKRKALIIKNNPQIIERLTYEFFDIIKHCDEISDITRQIECIIKPKEEYI